MVRKVSNKSSGRQGRNESSSQNKNRRVNKVNEKAETSLDKDRSFENKISSIQREKPIFKSNKSKSKTKVKVSNNNNNIIKPKFKTIEENRINDNKEAIYKKEIQKLK